MKSSASGSRNKQGRSNQIEGINEGIYLIEYSRYTDEELMQMLKDGQSEIMDYIMEKYKPFVRKKANAMFLIGGENEDLIQEGMIGLFKAVRDYRQDRESSFFHFARLCISRQMYSAIEASNRKKNQPLNSYVSITGEEDGALEEILKDEDNNPEELVIKQEYHKSFWEKLGKGLSKMELQVLNLYLEGKDYIQIAKIMDKTPKSIDNALQRIRQKIRILIEKEGD